MLYNPTPRSRLAGLVATVATMSPARADRVVRAFPGGSLATATPDRLQAAGCTARQAAALAAAVDLARSVQTAAEDRDGVCQCPRDVVDVIRRRIADREQEWFVAVLLDSRQRVIDLQTVAIGTLSSVDVHPREVFRDAIRLAVHSVVVAHNHPSGDPTPSDADLLLTSRLVEAGRLVGIPVLDHLIVSRGAHTSLAASGQL